MAVALLAHAVIVTANLALLPHGRILFRCLAIVCGCGRWLSKVYLTTLPSSRHLSIEHGGSVSESARASSCLSLPDRDEVESWKDSCRMS